MARRKPTLWKKCKFCGKGYKAVRTDQLFCIPQHAWAYHNAMRLKSVQIYKKVQDKILQQEGNTND